MPWCCGCASGPSAGIEANWKFPPCPWARCPPVRLPRCCCGDSRLRRSTPEPWRRQPGPEAPSSNSTSRTVGVGAGRLRRPRTARADGLFTGERRREPRGISTRMVSPGWSSPGPVSNCSGNRDGRHGTWWARCRHRRCRTVSCRAPAKRAIRDVATSEVATGQAATVEDQCLSGVSRQGEPEPAGSRSPPGRLPRDHDRAADDRSLRSAEGEPDRLGRAPGSRVAGRRGARG